MNNQDFNTSYHNVGMPVIIQQSHQGNKQYPQHGQVPGLRERIHRNGLMIFIYTYIYNIVIYILYIYHHKHSTISWKLSTTTSNYSTSNYYAQIHLVAKNSPELLMHPASSSLLKKDMLTTCHQNSAPSSGISVFGYSGIIPCMIFWDYQYLSFQTSQY